VLSPYWTDLNPTSGGRVLVNVLTDGVDTWIVVEWEAVREFSDPETATFQVWIGITGDANPTQDISYAYGPVGNGDLGFLTVGAENDFGNRGNNWYFDGAGTLPVEGDDLVVVAVPGEPGETHTITFDVVGNSVGRYTNFVAVTSDAFPGTSIFSFSGEVTRS
jgi:hypothetical protein